MVIRGKYKGFILIDTIIGLIVIGILIQITYNFEKKKLESRKSYRHDLDIGFNVLNKIETKIGTKSENIRICQERLFAGQIYFLCPDED